MLIMLDGLDEVPLGMRSRLIEWMNRQMNRYPQSLFILTSRPKAYRQATAENLEFPTAFWVQEFDAKQRDKFIERWYLCQEVYARGGRKDEAVQQAAREAAKHLSDQIQRRSELQDMAKNPLLLTMMTTFHRRYNQADLPRRRVELYEDICRLQLKERPKARQLESVLLNCNAQEILQPLALEMMQRQSRLLRQDEVLAILQNTLAARSEAIAAADFLAQVTDIGELLIQQEEDYQFSHLSFQEYLAAVELVKRQQEALLYDRMKVQGEFADAWPRLMLMYACLANPTNLIREALRQGRADLADQLYRETTKQIDDPELKAQLEGLKPAVVESKYAQLKALLQAGKWAEADQETYRLMIRAVGKEEGQGFTSQDLAEVLPQADLLAIDRAWVEASQGHFGFSVQKQIWQDCGSPMGPGKDWDRFCDRVGWKVGGNYVNYSDLKKNPLISLKGEIPIELSVKLAVTGYWTLRCSLFSRRDLRTVPGDSPRIF
jgi:GUN4-like